MRKRFGEKSGGFSQSFPPVDWFLFSHRLSFEVTLIFVHVHIVLSISCFTPPVSFFHAVSGLDFLFWVTKSSLFTHSFVCTGEYL